MFLLISNVMHVLYANPENNVFLGFGFWKWLLRNVWFFWISFKFVFLLKLISGCEQHICSSKLYTYETLVKIAYIRVLV